MARVTGMDLMRTTGTHRPWTARRFTVLLGGLCCCSCRRGCLLLLVLMLLCLGGLLLLLLLLLLRLLGLPFSFLLRQLSIAILSLPGQLGVGCWLECKIRSTAGIVVPSVAPSNKYRRIRTMALGVIRFRFGAGSSVHVVHRRRRFRIRIDV